MFYVNFTGRCGNQFFQYSFFRKIQMLVGDESIPNFNFYNVLRWREKTGDATFSDALKLFKVIRYNASYVKENEILLYGTKKQKRIFLRHKFYRALSEKLHIPAFARNHHRIMQKNGIYYEDCFFDYLNNPKSKNVFIKGYFENLKYYIGLEQKLKLELTPLTHASLTMLFGGKTVQKNTVCLSIRVWNEVANNDKLLKSREVCTKEYYEKAVGIINTRISNPVFIVFSNDIEWVKTNLNFNGNPVLFEPPGLSIDEKVSLMTSCEHYILSTSTFSWWVQYIGKSKNSLIISPNKWYTDKKDHLIEDDWIKVVV